MRQILPVARDNVDPAEVIGRETRITTSARPWVMANMVMSADGAYASSGTSRAISSDADREMFHMLRAACDVVLVGAGTARAERYRRPGTAADFAPFRTRLGLSPVPRLAVITSTATFPTDQPFLSGDGPDPVIFMPDGSDPDVPLPSVEIRRLDTAVVHPGDVLRSLYNDGARVVLCEGGPHLLGQLASAGLVDEFFLTLAPVLIGGTHTGLMGGVAEFHHEMQLHRLVEAGGHLMLNYRSEADPGD